MLAVKTEKNLNNLPGLRLLGSPLLVYHSQLVCCSAGTGTAGELAVVQPTSLGGYPDQHQLPDGCAKENLR